ncbi:hypothetical protein NECAME_14968 [Necator americanus]|uniref:Uncharacterized protein n=1 Tax=Necator americanus TaxID=51031 RepID=W2SKI8_NECAM|nr:hypothetical protein NECAME_14968 [Necator americanus]ETN70130.1 hypothetical protein NECAME_14968 [Necator americanus]
MELEAFSLAKYQQTPKEGRGIISFEGGSYDGTGYVPEEPDSCTAGHIPEYYLRKTFSLTWKWF